MSDANKQLCQILLAGTASGDDVSACLARGASANASDAGMSALHWAARSGLADAVGVLLKHGADVTSRSTNAGSEDTPLHAALWVGADDENAAPVVRALLAAGASPGAVNAKGELALHLAAERGLIVVIDALAAVTDLAARSKDGQTALERALVQGKVGAAVRLLTHGAPVDDACVKRASQAQVRELLERVRRDGAPALSEFTAFACVLAEHISPGPALDASLSIDEVRVLLEKLATGLGEDVGRGLAQNDDVDHFQEEYGDSWLDELIDSYWMNAHEDTMRTAWGALPLVAQQEVALEDLLDDARARFEAAVREHA